MVNQIKRNRQQIAWCHYNELEPGEVDGQIGLLIDVSILMASCFLVTGRQECQPASDAWLCSAAGLWGCQSSECQTPITITNPVTALILKQPPQ